LPHRPWRVPDQFKPLRNLRWARHVSARPMPGPISEWARQGLAYERRVAKSLAEAGIDLLHNPGFEYEADTGPGYCVPDIIIRNYNGTTLIIECKLTYKPEAIIKSKSLYAPVVAMAFDTVPISLVVAKSLTAFAPEPQLTLDAAVCLSKLSEKASPGAAGVGYLIHWLGRGIFPIL
jgi:hypothetical protein